MDKRERYARIIDPSIWGCADVGSVPSTKNDSFDKRYWLSLTKADDIIGLELEGNSAQSQPCGLGPSDPEAGLGAESSAADQVLFMREDDDPVEYRRLVQRAQGKIDAELAHEDLCRIGRVFNLHSDLRDDLNRRANETLKRLIAQAFGLAK